MSLKSHAMRSLVATGAVAFASLGLVAPANAAIDAKLVYQCKFPIIAPGTISMDIQGPDIPSTWPIGTPTPEWLITTKATLNAPIPKAMSSIKGLASIEGVPGGVVADASLNLKRADGEFSVPAVVDLAVPPVPFTPTSDATKTLDVIATGSAPSQYQDDPATGQIVLNSIALNFIARDNTGAALKLAPVTRNWENQPITDSDGNPETFDVICRLDPNTPNQSLILADIAFVSEPEPNKAPGAPGATTATAGDSKVSLSWGAATDSDGTVKEYKVYQDGTAVKTVTGTSTEITGLTNDKAYSFQVAAVDDDNAEGAKNAAVSATPKGTPVPNQAPSSPVAAPRQSGDIGQTTAIIRWGAATDTDGTIASYKIQVDDETKTVTGDKREVTFTGLGPETDYVALVTAIDDDGASSKTPLEVTFTTGSADNVPPTKPGTPTGTATETEINLTWTASTDADGIKGYDVYQNGTKLATQATTNSAKISGLKPGTSYKFKVVAVDTKGLAGTASDEETIPTAADKTPPSAPVVSLVSKTTNSASIKWTASTDAGGVVAYDVYNGDTKVSSTDGNTLAATVGNLAAGTYTLKVVARDAANNSSTAGSVNVTIESGGGDNLVRYAYDLKGTALIKTLSKGSLPITGGIKAALDIETGNLEADLTLADTSGRLTALGFLPVTAKIGFAPSGKTTGSLREGSLETRSLVRIKVKEVKLFGAIPLAGGNNCQTKSLSEIKLKNTQEFFDYTVGGPIAGTFAISDLNGCGLLNGLVSPLTAGGGNQLTLNLQNPREWTP